MRDVNKASAIHEEQHLRRCVLWSEEPWKRRCGRRVYHWCVGNLAPAGPCLAWARFRHVSTAIIQSVWARLVGRVSLNYFALKPPEALPRHRAGATPTATAQQGSCRPCYSHRVLFGQPSDFVDDDDPLFRRWSLSGTRLGQA